MGGTSPAASRAVHLAAHLRAAARRRRGRPTRTRRRTGVKICFVNMPIEYYSPVSGGAISTIIAELAEELVGLAHGVTVLTYTDDQVHVAGEVVDLGPIPRLPRPLRAVDRVTRRMLQRPF